MANVGGVFNIQCASVHGLSNGNVVAIQWATGQVYDCVVTVVDTLIDTFNWPFGSALALILAAAGAILKAAVGILPAANECADEFGGLTQQPRRPARGLPHGEFQTHGTSL